MKKAVWLSVVVILLLSVFLVFAGSEESAIKTVKDESQVQSVQPQKVSEMRKVVILGNTQSNEAARQKVQYDEKGGIIVPNASKGIKISSQKKESIVMKMKAKEKSQKDSRQKYLERLGNKKQIPQSQSNSVKKQNN